MLWQAGALVLVLLLAGCSAPSSEPAGESSISTPFHTTAMEGCQDEQSSRCNESTLAIDAQGRIFVGNGVGTAIAVSNDDGRTWQQLPGPPLPVDRPTVRDQDSLVQVTRDDKVVFSALLTQAGGTGTNALLGLHVAVSLDGAQTWPVNQLLTLDDTHVTLGADRQWTADGPDGALYIAYSHIYTDPVLGPAPRPPLHPYTGNLMEVARSDDGGATWGPYVQVSARLEHTGAGGLIVTESGDLVLPTRAGPADRSTATLTLFRSTDRGQTWTSEPVVELPAGGREPWPSFAANADGSEAIAWIDGGVQFATRASPTTSWSEPMTWSRAGEASEVQPALAATDEGWAISYVTARGAEPKLVGDFVLIEGTNDGPVKHATLVADVALVFRGANSDFATLAIAPDGTRAVTVTLVEPEPAIDVYLVRP